MSSVKYRPAWAASASLLFFVFFFLLLFLFSLSVQLWPKQAPPKLLPAGGLSKRAAAGHFGTMRLVAVVVPLPQSPGAGGFALSTGLCWMIDAWRGGIGERERGGGEGFFRDWVLYHLNEWNQFWVFLFLLSSTLYCGCGPNNVHTVPNSNGVGGGDREQLSSSVRPGLAGCDIG